MGQTRRSCSQAKKGHPVMNVYRAQQIRNVAVVAHGQVGEDLAG